MNIQYGNCGMPEDAATTVARLEGLTAFCQAVATPEPEHPDQDLFDVHCCQAQAVCGGEWHDMACSVHGWAMDAAWSVDDDARWLAFAPEAKPF